MRGVLTRVEQKKEDWCGRKKQVIYMFVRGEDLKRYVFKDPFFEPYCYFRRGVININSFPKDIREHKVVTIQGKSYLKVWTYLPMQIAKLRNIIESKNPNVVSTYEADVVFPLRYIIDKKIRGSVEWSKKQRPEPIDENIKSNLRIAILDIELMLQRIKCLTIWDNYEKKYNTFYWNKKAIQTFPEEDWILDWSLTEKEMLSKALKFLIKRNPDVITGYNIDWDLVHIRSRVLENQLGKLWDSLNAVGYKMPPPRDRRKKFRDFWLKNKAQRIPGRNVIDLLEILLKTERHQMAEFNLNYVARNYLKPAMGKLSWKGIPIGPNIHKIWPKDPLAVLKYNRHDVKLCVELNKQQHLIAFADEVRKFAGCQLDDILSNKRIAHVELLRKTKKPLPVTKREPRGYKGAIVIEPKKGVYQWVIVMDFRSLYPSIILQLNIDPDTYIPAALRASRRWNLTNAFILKEKDTGSEFWFKKKPEGDLPSILRNYLKRRDEKKRQMKEARRRGKDQLAEIYDVQQNALKVIANAFYGSLKYRGVPSAFQCLRAITCGAREAILFAKKEIEKLGYNVLYGDSVIDKTPIVIRKDGKIDILPIEDLYPKEEDGRYPLKEIEALTEQGFSPIKYIYKHKTDKPRLVTNCYGGRIDSTPDHSFIVRGKETKPEETTKVEFLDFKLPQKKNMDLKKAWLLGFFTAEGSLSQRGINSYVIHFSNKKRELLEKCKRILKTLGIVSKIYETLDSTSAFVLNILESSKKSVLELFMSCLTKKGDKKVPQEILNSRREVKLSFLSGYLEGDGSRANKEGILEFGSIDQSLLAGLVQILKEENKTLTIDIREDKPEWTRVRVNKNPKDKRIKRKELIRKQIKLEPRVVFDLETENHHFVGGIGNILLHNTDSVMILSKFSSFKKCTEEAEYLSKTIERKIPKFLSTFGSGREKSYLHLALDKIFSKFLVAEKKKRYAGLIETKKGEGRLEVKGFGTVRSDASQFTRKLQKTLIREVLRGKNREQIKLIAEEELSRYNKESWLEIGVPCILTKPMEKYKTNSIQKKAFMFTNKYLKGKYRVGDKPKRLYVKMIEKKVPLEVIETVDVIVFNSDKFKLPNWLELDYPKMMERTVKPKIEKILEFVELEWKDLYLKKELRKARKKRKKKKKAKKKKIKKAKKSGKAK